MSGKGRVKKGFHPVRPWYWTHPACTAAAGRATHEQALSDLYHHLRMCPGHR